MFFSFTENVYDYRQHESNKLDAITWAFVWKRYRIHRERKQIEFVIVEEVYYTKLFLPVL